MNVTYGFCNMSSTGYFSCDPNTVSHILVPSLHTIPVPPQELTPYVYTSLSVANVNSTDNQWKSGSFEGGCRTNSNLSSRAQQGLKFSHLINSDRIVCSNLYG